MHMTIKSILVATIMALTAAQGAQAEVKIKGKSEQKTDVKGAVLNAAVGAGAKARQSLASNVGKVNIGGDNKQTVNVKGAVLNAAVGAGTKAEQQLSSNVSE